MCGRFTQRYTWDEVQDLYGLMGAASNLQAHYNIAPTDTIDVVKPGDGANRLVPMRWGLVPWWWAARWNVDDNGTVDGNY